MCRNGYVYGIVFSQSESHLSGHVLCGIEQYRNGPATLISFTDINTFVQFRVPNLLYRVIKKSLCT